MDNTQTGLTPSTSMDIYFDIYGSRFNSGNTGSSSVVHCLWDDTEVNYVELDKKLMTSCISKTTLVFIVYQLIDMLSFFVSSQNLLYLMLIGSNKTSHRKKDIKKIV